MLNKVNYKLFVINFVYYNSPKNKQGNTSKIGKNTWKKPEKYYLCFYLSYLLFLFQILKVFRLLFKSNTSNYYKYIEIHVLYLQNIVMIKEKKNLLLGKL